MEDQRSVMVFIDQTDGLIADVSLELICKARELADQLRCQVEAVAVGGDMHAVLPQLGHYGCDRVYAVSDPRLAAFTSVPYAKAVLEVVRLRSPQVVLFGATTTGRDLAPRVASALRCGLTADCTDLQIGAVTLRKQTFTDTLLQIRPAFGGNIVATIVSPEISPSMATVREGVMRLEAPDTARTCEIVPVAMAFTDADFPTTIVEIIRSEKTVNLKSARIIVTAGMGAATPEGIALIKKLAKVLGGQVGASRPVVDAGLLPRAHQVGQTGTTVRPNLYIACGVSGQIQHRAGMSEAMRIIAINADAGAPIFDIAHYGIVGDIHTVIPQIISAYKEK
ncbi:MAG: electron transfer flavoprotein subunit alpha/FixB family protein [Pseudomonadota bacterium]